MKIKRGVGRPSKIFSEWLHGKTNPPQMVGTYVIRAIKKLDRDSITTIAYWTGDHWEYRSRDNTVVKKVSDQDVMYMGLTKKAYMKLVTKGASLAD